MSLDPRDIHQIDQAMGELVTYFIPILFDFYSNCIKTGFSEDQAFKLTTMFANALFSASKFLSG